MIQVKCKSDCCRVAVKGTAIWDTSPRCYVPAEMFKDINVKPSVDNSECICPFYISTEELEYLFWKNHSSEHLEFNDTCKQEDELQNLVYAALKAHGCFDNVDPSLLSNIFPTDNTESSSVDE